MAILPFGQVREIASQGPPTLNPHERYQPYLVLIPESFFPPCMVSEFKISVRLLRCSQFPTAHRSGKWETILWPGMTDARTKRPEAMLLDVLFDHKKGIASSSSERILRCEFVHGEIVSGSMGTSTPKIEASSMQMDMAPPVLHCPYMISICMTFALGNACCQVAIVHALPKTQTLVPAATCTGSVGKLV